MCKLKKVANGPKERSGGEEEVLSDMEGADEVLGAEEAPPQKERSSKAAKRKAADVDAGDHTCLPHSMGMYA